MNKAPDVNPPCQLSPGYGPPGRPKSLLLLTADLETLINSIHFTISELKSLTSEPALLNNAEGLRIELQELEKVRKRILNGLEG